MVTQPDEPDVVGEFEAAWTDPKHTRAIQSSIDINQVLRERYETDKPLTFTRAMLWDLEQRKAAAPGSYIPFVVRAGTDRSWSRPSSRQGVQILSAILGSGCGYVARSTAWSSNAPIWTTSDRS